MCKLSSCDSKKLVASGYLPSTGERREANDNPWGTSASRYHPHHPRLPLPPPTHAIALSFQYSDISERA